MEVIYKQFWRKLEQAGNHIFTSFGFTGRENNNDDYNH